MSINLSIRAYVHEITQMKAHCQGFIEKLSDDRSKLENIKKYIENWEEPYSSMTKEELQNKFSSYIENFESENHDLVIRISKFARGELQPAPSPEPEPSPRYSSSITIPLTQGSVRTPWGTNMLRVTAQKIFHLYGVDVSAPVIDQLAKLLDLKDSDKEDLEKALHSSTSGKTLFDDGKGLYSIEVKHGLINRGAPLFNNHGIPNPKLFRFILKDEESLLKKIEAGMPQATVSTFGDPELSDIFKLTIGEDDFIIKPSKAEKGTPLSKSKGYQEMSRIEQEIVQNVMNLDLPKKRSKSLKKLKKLFPDKTVRNNIIASAQVFLSERTNLSNVVKEFSKKRERGEERFHLFPRIGRGIANMEKTQKEFIETVHLSLSEEIIEKQIRKNKILELGEHPGIAPGEAYIREEAYYGLSLMLGFSDLVPPTKTMSIVSPTLSSQYGEESLLCSAQPLIKDYHPVLCQTLPETTEHTVFFQQQVILSILTANTKLSEGHFDPGKLLSLDGGLCMPEVLEHQEAFPYLRDFIEKNNEIHGTFTEEMIESIIEMPETIMISFCQKIGISSQGLYLLKQRIGFMKKAAREKGTSMDALGLLKAVLGPKIGE